MAYNNARYQRNFIRPTYEKRALPAIQPIQAIQPQQAIKPIYAARSIDEQRNTYNKHKTYLANYNDPTELNSFIDALTNTEAVSKEFGEFWGGVSTTSGTAAVLTNIAAVIVEAAGWIVSALAPDAGTIGVAGSAGAAAIRGAKVVKAANTIKNVAKGLKTASKILAIPAIPAATKVAYDYGVKPIVAGKGNEAFLNTLMNFGETMDAAANPVKGLILEGPDGFTKGLGYMSPDGRTNYDYDTGVLVADIALEMLSDPINWIENGGKFIMKKQIVAQAKPTAQTLTRTILIHLENADPKTAKYVEKKLTKKLVQISTSWALQGQKALSSAEIAKMLADGRTSLQQTLVKTIKKIAPDLKADDIQKVLSGAGRDIRTGKFIEGALKQISNIRYDTLVTNVISNTASLIHYTDDFQRFLFKGAMLTSGYGLGVEAARYGWEGLAKWANNLITAHLKPASAFKDKVGLDIKQWDTAKGIWIASHQYTTALTGEVSQRNIHTFYTFAKQQFNRDRQVIQKILLDTVDSAERIVRIDEFLNTMYKCDLKEYTQLLKQIDSVEPGRQFKYFTDYLENVDVLLKEQAQHVLDPTVSRTSKQIYKATDLKSLYQYQTDVLQKLQEQAIKQKGKVVLADVVYQIKLNDAYVNALLLNDESLINIFSKLDSSTDIGVLLEKILKDANIYSPKRAAIIPVAARVFKQTARSFLNTRELYERICNMPVPKIKGITEDQFKRYILDELFGFNKAPDVLLAEFDNIVMPDFIHRLEVMLMDKGITFTDTSLLYEQVGSVFKYYLTQQSELGITRLGEIIPKDFTKYVQQFTQRLSLFEGELAELNAAAQIIYTLFAAVDNKNIALLQSILTDKNTIFSIRELSDYGLALKAIATKADLDYWDIPADFSNPLLEQMSIFGHNVNRLKKNIAQYTKFFEKQGVEEYVNQVYENVITQFLNKKVGLPVLAMFQYLKNTTDTLTRFSQIAELKRYIQNDKNLLSDFKKCLTDVTATKDHYEMYSWFLDPSPLQTTEFAWEAMAQTAWIAERKFNEEIINGITAYKNLSIFSRKITNDFQTIRQFLTANKLDRAKLLQQERFIKAATKINDTLEYLENYYQKLYNTEIANTQLENVRNVLNYFPELATKYSKLVDDLEAYWAGEKTFKQSAKAEAKIYNDARYELINAYKSKNFGMEPDETAMQVIKQTLHDEFEVHGIIDEFTPFWEEIKKMNTEIQNTVKDYNQKLYEEIVGNKLSKKGLQYYIDFIDEFDFKNLPKDISAEDRRILSEYQTKYIRYNNPNTDYRTLRNVEDIPGALSLIDAVDIDEPTRRAYKTQVKEIQKINDILENRKQRKKELLSKINGPEKHNVDVAIQAYDKATHEYKIIARGTGRITKSGLRVSYVDSQGQKIVREFPEAVKVVQQQPYRVSTRRTGRMREVQYGDETGTGKTLMPEIEISKHVDHKYTFDVETHKTVRAYDKTGSSTDLEITVPERVSFIRIDTPEYQHMLDTKIKKTEGALNAKLRSKETIQMNKHLMEATKQHNQILDENFRYLYKLNLNNMYKEQRLKYDIITPWDPIREQQQLNKAINTATDRNARATLYKLVRMSPEQFEQELAFRHRFITFTQDDIAEGQLKYMFEHFIKTLDSTRVHHYYDAQQQRHWFVLDKSQKVNASGRQYYLNGVPLTRLQNTKQFNEFEVVDQLITDSKNPGITKMLNDLDNSLEELTGSRLGDSQGEYLNKDMLQKIYQQMPKEIQDLIDIKDLLDKQFFDAYLFNESVLGTMASKHKLGMYSSNMIKNTSNAMTHAQCYLKPKVEYVHTIFDSEFSIGNPNGIFKGFSDEDLLEALQANGEYKLVALVDHPKYGMRTREILPTSIKSIQKAKELGAVVIPLQTYKDMYNVVNHRLGSEGFAKLWSRILYAYKSGYLIKPGAFIRNWIDTNLKSRLEMGNEYRTYNDLSHRILNEVQQMKDDVIKQMRITDKLESVKPMKELQQEWFERNGKVLTYEQFIELDRDFLSQSISGNIMADLYAGEGGDLWKMFTDATGRIVEAGNRTENYNRLAVYLYHLDNGLDYTSALSRLAKTHFDYGFKTMAEQLLEMMFPFATFSMRNHSYWVEMLEKYPWIASNYAHLMKPSWDFQDYTPEELAANYRAQAQIRYGQIKLAEFNDKIITFKANPSIQDALQMFSDPINNIYEKLAAPISVPLALATDQYTQPTNLIPIVGPAIQSVQTMVKTGSPMPSAIGVTKQYKPYKRSTKVSYKNKNLSSINQYRDSNYKVPKYRNNIVFDSYKTIGTQRYRLNMYPVIDIAHDIKSKYTVNVYNRIKNKVQTDVYKGIRYRLKLDVNRFR